METQYLVRKVEKCPACEGGGRMPRAGAEFVSSVCGICDGHGKIETWIGLIDALAEIVQDAQTKAELILGWAEAWEKAHTGS